MKSDSTNLIFYEYLDENLGLVEALTKNVENYFLVKNQLLDDITVEARKVDLILML